MKKRITTPAIEKYIPAITQAEDFQVKALWERAEEAANGKTPIDGLTQHDAAVLAKYCWDEMVERGLK